MKIPLAKRLKKRAHLELAMLQDEVVELLYFMLDPESRPVLHGGTAIWRCYSGVRFSEDLDFYCKPPEGFGRKLEIDLEKHGMTLVKYKEAPTVVFAKISNGTTVVKLELSSAKVPVRPAMVVKHYEKATGESIDVYTLSPEELILEKIDAYRNRGFIRDIYDIYHLSSQVLDPPNPIAHQIIGFLSNIKPPIDEKNLRALVYSGVAPSFKEMVADLRRRFE